jgi:hypothetical protein
MRISTDKDDPGYLVMTNPVIVLLDGERVSCCVMADSHLGEVVFENLMELETARALGIGATQARRITRNGKVEIYLREDSAKTILQLVEERDTPVETDVSIEISDSSSTDFAGVGDAFLTALPEAVAAFNQLADTLANVVITVDAAQDKGEPAKPAPVGILSDSFSSERLGRLAR